MSKAIVNDRTMLHGWTLDQWTTVVREALRRGVNRDHYMKLIDWWSETFPCDPWCRTLLLTDSLGRAVEQPIDHEARRIAISMFHDARKVSFRDLLKLPAED